MASKKNPPGRKTQGPLAALVAAALASPIALASTPGEAKDKPGGNVQAGGASQSSQSRVSGQAQRKTGIRVSPQSKTKQAK